MKYRSTSSLVMLQSAHKDRPFLVDNIGEEAYAFFAEARTEIIACKLSLAPTEPASNAPSA